MTEFELKLQHPLQAFELNLQLCAKHGEILAFLGPSGAGKTTILRIIAGLLRPKEGQITYNDTVWLDTATNTELSPQRRHCGYLPQNCSLFNNMTALDNVTFGLQRLSRQQKRDQARKLLHRFGLEVLADRYPPELSGGECQRVALARALAARPNLLLLDEPLAALDPLNRKQTSEFLAETIYEAACLTIIVTHHFEEVREIADQIVIIDDGKLVQKGRPAEIANAPASEIAAQLVERSSSNYRW